jgi:predicted ArsR family transcriptional regulator
VLVKIFQVVKYGCAFPGWEVFSQLRWRYPQEVSLTRAFEDLAALAVLEDPVRRRLFVFVRSRQGSVTREEAAGEVGISRKLAAFHLDKLADSGLLEVVELEDGRRGPGRPAKRYRVATVELSVTLPERRYDFIAQILVDAVVRARPGEDPEGAALRVARETGEEVGLAAAESRQLGRVGPERALSAAAAVLSELGYEPDRRGGTSVALRNCPFHHLAERSPELICALNLSFVAGLVGGLGSDRVTSRLVAPEGGCCVSLELAGE